MKMIAYELLFALRILDAAGDIESLWSTHDYVVAMQPEYPHAIAVQVAEGNGQASCYTWHACNPSSLSHMPAQGTGNPPVYD